jgi:RNA polymerase sigma-70 factor (ECF subfamily)
MPEPTKITEEYLGYKGVISSLLSKLGYVSKPDIEDILQETYIRTYKSAIEREIKFPKAYMVKTALRLAKRIREKSFANCELETLEQRPIEELSAEITSAPKDEPESSAISMEAFSQLCDAVNQLPAQCRKVFILKKIFGQSQKEIAKSLSISESTVEKHIAKGMLLCNRYISSQKKAHSETTAPSEIKHSIKSS